MKDIERRLERLEGERHGAQGEPDEDVWVGFERFWEMEMEWIALHLIRGIEPDFTLDETGAFWTLDGRFALSPRRMDLCALMGPRTQEIQQAIPSERWGRFLVADAEAAGAQNRLEQLGTELSAGVPEPERPQELGRGFAVAKS